MSDLDVLVEELSPVNSKWKELGAKLGVTVRGMEATQPSDGLRKMLREWLQEDLNPRWHEVLRALRSVGEGHLASELKVKYGELTTTDSSLICLMLNLVSIQLILVDLYYY